jgi:hypothetical protein
MVLLCLPCWLLLVLLQHVVHVVTKLLLPPS